MTADYWQRQGEKPLYPDLLWSRPENRQHAGKLLIIGGNLYSFAAAANAYQAAQSAGMGTGRVLLPSALQKTVGRLVENGEFAPSTSSGSFSQQALAEWLESARWADAVLLAGDFGRNSQTAIVAEKFLTAYSGQVVVTKDAIDFFNGAPAQLLQRSRTTLALSLAQLQKLTTGLADAPVTFSMGLPQLVDWLHSASQQVQCQFITFHQANLLVANQGEVTTTKVGSLESWRVVTAAHTAVWQMQNPGQPLAAATTAIYELFKNEIGAAGRT